MASSLLLAPPEGFGLALARELVSCPATDVSKVIASTRGDSTVLDELAKNSSGRIVVVKLDVTNEESIKRAAAEVEAALEGKGLDVLINNAGVCQYAPDGVKSMDNLQESLTINVLGVHWVTREFLPLLRKGNLKKVANISTTLGSTTLAGPAHYLPAPAYKISKATMNALTWMKADLGGGDMADLTPEQGAKASLDIIFTPGQKYNGLMPKVLVKGLGEEPRKQSVRWDHCSLVMAAQVSAFLILITFLRRVKSVYVETVERLKKEYSRDR